MKPAKELRSKSAVRAIVIAMCLLAAVLASTFVPWRTGRYSSRPDPAASYEEAIQRVQAFDPDDGASMNPVCRTQLLTHGARTEGVIVLVHGYTNCPEQFRPLGQRFFDSGYNVLIAPMPHHGLADRMTDDISQLTIDGLAVYADQVVDIAQGLGDTVVVAGISAGGVVTAWAAQNRDDVNLAVVISPALGFKQIPTAITVPAINIISVMPESYAWWEPELQMKTEPPYAYPRYSMHGLTQISGLGFAVQNAARRDPPAAGSILVVTNAAEPSVNNELTRQVTERWRAGGADIATYEFPADLMLPHDLMDPNQPDARTDIVYPKMLELVEQNR